MKTNVWVFVEKLENRRVVLNSVDLSVNKHTDAWTIVCSFVDCQQWKSRTMGDNKVDPKVLKKTQDTLGKIIKKPPLTDKLLSKPPFRFLHDICTSVSSLWCFLCISCSWHSQWHIKYALKIKRYGKLHCIKLWLNLLISLCMQQPFSLIAFKVHPAPLLVKFLSSWNKFQL